MASLVWLIVALALLALFNPTLHVSFSYDQPGTSRSLISLMLLPYRIRSTPPLSVENPKENPDESANTTEEPRNETRRLKPSKSWPAAKGHPDFVTPDSPPLRPGDAGDQPTFVVRIEMPPETGLRSWRFYEACIETFAVGIYLYATFVLTSTLFLSGEEAITYASVLILSLAAVRLLCLVF